MMLESIGYALVFVFIVMVLAFLFEALSKAASQPLYLDDIEDYDDGRGPGKTGV